MSTPTTAWLRRVSLACACGVTSAALGQTPQPFSPPPNPQPIAAPAAPQSGQGTVAFRAAPAPNTVPAGPVAAAAALPPGTQYAQPANFQVAPGQTQQG